MKRLLAVFGICALVLAANAAVSGEAAAQHPPGFRPGPHPGPGPYPGPYVGPRPYPGPRFYPYPGPIIQFRPYPPYPPYPPYYPYPYPYPYPPYAEAPPVVYPAVPAEDPMAGEAVEALPPDCQMIREYQTKVIVDGKPVDAYGDACLMPDGSWIRGPVKIAPQ